MSTKKKPPKSLKVKATILLLSLVGFIFLYLLFAWCVANLMAAWHANELPFQESRSEGSLDALYLIELLDRHPSYPLPKKAAALRQRIIAIGNADPVEQKQINDIIAPHHLHEYILDLTDFAPMEVLSKSPYTKISVKNCETESILYVYLPKENEGLFYLCRNNRLHLNKSWKIS